NGEDPYFLTTRSVVKLILGFVTPDFVQGNYCVFATRNQGNLNIYELDH
ncbi:MAG: hypothetical protein ACI81P_002215, partial [Neolewinella sp.]